MKLKLLDNVSDEVENKLIECTKFGFNYQDDLSDEMKGWFLTRSIDRWKYNLYTKMLSRMIYDPSHPAHNANF